MTWYLAFFAVNAVKEVSAVSASETQRCSSASQTALRHLIGVSYPGQSARAASGTPATGSSPNMASCRMNPGMIANSSAVSASASV